MAEKNLYKKFEPIGKEWLKFLDRYNDEPFLSKPNENTWSLGQLYNHLSLGSLDFHIKKIEDCISKKGGKAKGKRKFKGTMMFLKNKFPNKKIASPSHKKNPPANPENREDARNNMIRLLKAMSEYGPKVAKADLTYKVEHPLFGFLNAKEWYKLVMLHFNHHLKQKQKLDKRLMK